MKKLLALLMALSAVFLFSCANDSGDDSGDENTSDSVSDKTANGQTYTSNSYTAEATSGTVTAAYNDKDAAAYTLKFNLAFPTDNDTYFYKCYSGLKDGYTISCTENDEITLPDPKAYYLQFKKSDNTLNAVYRAPYGVAEWQGGLNYKNEYYTYRTDTKYDPSKVWGSGDNNDTLTFVYSSTNIQIANINESTTFDWDEKSAVYLYHSPDCKESYSIVEDEYKIITDIKDYFVNFDGDACDEVLKGSTSVILTAKIKLDGTDKILTITVE